MRLFKTEIKILQDIAYSGAYFSDIMDLRSENGREGHALDRLLMLGIIKSRLFDLNVSAPFRVFTFR